VLLGCVVYAASECPFFKKKTVIQPDSQFDIQHYKLTVERSRGSLEILGLMPDNFGQSLVDAIRRSETLDAKRKRWLSTALGIDCS
jgi:hypothetical protein